jgi:urea transport system permease protein
LTATSGAWRRGTILGPIIGAILVNAGKSYFTGALPEYWLFALGGLFVVVTLFMPKGIVGLWAQFRDSRRNRAASHAPADRTIETKPSPEPAE